MGNVFGYNQASSTKLVKFDVECPDCGHEWTSVDGDGRFAVTRKLLNGQTSRNYTMNCPSCSTTVEHDVESIPTATGTRPTKRLIIGQELYHVHGRDRTTYPSDLAESIEESNKLLRENGYEVETDEEE